MFLPRCHYEAESYLPKIFKRSVGRRQIYMAYGHKNTSANQKCLQTRARKAPDDSLLGRDMCFVGKFHAAKNIYFHTRKRFKTNDVEC